MANVALWCDICGTGKCGVVVWKMWHRQMWCCGVTNVAQANVALWCDKCGTGGCGGGVAMAHRRISEYVLPSTTVSMKTRVCMCVCVCVLAFVYVCIRVCVRVVCFMCKDCLRTQNIPVFQKCDQRSLSHIGMDLGRHEGKRL